MSQKRDDDERIKPLVERTLILPPTQRDRVQDEGQGDSSQDPLFIAAVDKKILHYKITGILGQGGQAKVYRAWDENLKRQVALKFLPHRPNTGGPERERFVREATAVSALDHPNIAAVHAIEETPEGLFIVMPCYDGENLSERIAKGRLTPNEAIDFAAQIGSGIAAAHAAGVVHRDLKPSNIILTKQGLVKIVDFGLAKVDGNTRLTETGTRIGTVSYMSPEQVRGEPIDYRSDIWSFGIVLFEMLTGDTPFQGDNIQKVFHGILMNAVPPMAGIAPAIQTVVNRMLAKQPEDRYQTATALVADLKAALNVAPAATVTLPPVRSSRRMWLATVVVSACLVAGAIGISRWATHDEVQSTIENPTKQIAVLPLRNIGGDQEQQAFIDGLTETLTLALTRQPGLSVIAPSDSRKFETAAEARREFGVNLVISGSVQHRGDNVRLILGLVDAQTQQQIDTQSVELPSTQLPTLEDGAVAKLADMLNVAVSPGSRELLRASTSRMASAYEAYLRGRGYLYRWDVTGSYERARAAFDDAIQRDPNFAAAHASLAETLARMHRDGFAPSVLDSARLAANTAVMLNPNFANGHAALGAVFIEAKQPVEAERELETALRLDPLDPAAYRELANLFQSQRKFPEQERVLLSAVAARPGDWYSQNELGIFYRSQQRYADAERAYRRVVKLSPDNHVGYRNLGVALVSLGRNQEAEDALNKALKLRPTASVYNNLGALLMFEKRYAEAVPIMEKASELAPVELPVSFRLWGNLGDAYWLAKRNPEKARAAWLKASEIVEKQLTGTQSDAERLSFLANYLAKAGQKEDAVRRIESALVYAPNSATVRYQAALVFAIVSQKDRALSELRLAIDHGYSVSEIRAAPELEPLRMDPQYELLFKSSSGR